jgi:hypothetical protein
VTFALVILKSDANSARLSNHDGEFYAIVHWVTDLRSRGKLIAGAELALPSQSTRISWTSSRPVTHAMPADPNLALGGVLLIGVDNAKEALEIARSWPVRSRFQIELCEVVANW